MSTKDTVSHKYLSDNERFADAFNYLIYNGEQVIKPEDLTPQEATEKVVINILGRITTVKKYRDVLKQAVIKSDKNNTYAILGIENQSDIHYAMPVRNMLYDALNYADQVSKTSKQLRLKKTKPSRSEFLSGFTRNDKLKPVITIVINWSQDRWDGPIRLSDMIDNHDPRLSPFINDYELKLIDPHAITNFNSFHSQLGDVLHFINCQNEKKKFKAMLTEKGDRWELDLDSVNAINTFTGAILSVEDAKEGKLDMCKALQELMEDSKTEGLENGIELLSAMYAWLYSNNRDEDAKRAAVDPSYRDKLLKEYKESLK